MSMYSGLGSDNLESIISLLNKYVEVAPEIVSKVLLTKHPIDTETVEKLDGLTCGLTCIDDKFYISALGLINGLVAIVSDSNNVIVATIEVGDEDEEGDTKTTDEDAESDTEIIHDFFLGKLSDFYIEE